MRESEREKKRERESEREREKISEQCQRGGALRCLVKCPSDLPIKREMDEKGMVGEGEGGEALQKC